MKAPGANNIPIINQTGVNTDFRGYTVIPGVSPYARYDISLDSGRFADDIDIPTNSKMAIPTRDAIVRVEFDVNEGFRTLMTLARAGGKNVPFGATVSTDARNETNASIVGDKGLVYLSGLAEKGELFVKWGTDADKACRVNYQLDVSKMRNGIIMSRAVCQ